MQNRPGGGLSFALGAEILRPNPLDIPVSGVVELYERKRGATW